MHQRVVLIRPHNMRKRSAGTPQMGPPIRNGVKIGGRVQIADGPGLQVMRERIPSGAQFLPVLRNIPGNIEQLRRADRLRAPAAQEMCQAGLVRWHVVGRAVPARIEIHDGPPVMRFPHQNVVHQGIDVQAGQIGVGLAVPADFEIDVRPAVLPPAEATVMHDRVQFGFMHIGRVDQVVVFVDQPGLS